MRVTTRDISPELIDEIIEALEKLRKKPLSVVDKELRELIQSLDNILEI